MTRIPLALVALALAACSTDTKTANVVDANATAPANATTGPVDAGLLAQADAPDLDAGMPADAGHLGPDAGLHPVVTASNTGDPVRPELPVAEGKGTPFDRVLAKPRVQGGDLEVLKAAVEKKTGHKIALVRKTAGKWVLLQFAPTAKGRDAGDQQKLVDVLKSMEELASVEGDRLMKVKQP